MRLDKIDLGISTQASTMASFHGTIDRGFSGLSTKVSEMGDTVAESFGVLATAQKASKKRDVVMIVLMIVNVVAVIGILFGR